MQVLTLAFHERATYNACMSKKAKLTAEDREFFELVASAIFVNPFSDERARVDALIVGDTAASGADAAERVRLFVPRVRERIGKLDASGLGKPQLFAAQEKELLEYAHLFNIYHRHIDDFDALIQAQVEHGDSPIRVPFADEVLKALKAHGFEPDRAVRYFSLFYQLRRAFYFIERGLIGSSQSMKRLRRALWDNVFTHDIRLYDLNLWESMEDFSTLLLGETGTGKGTAAAAIGRSGYIPFDSNRCTFKESFTRTFVAINLSQFPETLIESELFGHKKGSFTGAVEDHEGIFARCSRHGALFLDEIGEVSIPVQIKLLQVLEQRTFSPVGSHEKVRFGGRVIAATNQSIHTQREEGRFRDDFFYRLCSDTIVLPPLRQRIAESPSELGDLLTATVRRIIGEPSPEVLRLVCESIDRDLPADYGWPGNVRELEQAVRRILLTGSYKGDVRLESSDALTALTRGMETGTLDASEVLSQYCALLYGQYSTYEEVARRTNLDRRTVKKYVQACRETDEQ